MKKDWTKKCNMEVYIIYNIKDNRPAVCSSNYGQLLVYGTREQAQAFISTGSEIKPSYEKEFEIRRVTLN